eukprot:TRINITY_DN17525_c0_g1_i1.p1 TRINITY_DN17525_c0_g1~~TRINITY_DN17525_c0_g1_i1.p1  ORF type:complete len:273 (-),score=64.95 TRINITY_DN17525_c0_g1_i1:235-1053(-)
MYSNHSKPVFGYDDPHIRHIHEHNALHYNHHQKPVTNGKKGTGNQRTTDPIVTGTSVLGIKYKDGILIAADTLASYGSLARFKVLERVKTLGTQTIVGGSGDYSDFQAIMKILEDLNLEDELADDGAKLTPASIHSYLTRVLYGRRNKMDPLWGSILIGGVTKEGSFLGLADLHGTSYECETIATGYGAYIALPLLRKNWSADMSFEAAKTLLENCLRVLYYRDARATNKIQIANATKDGVTVSEPYELATDWSSGVIHYEKDIRNFTGYDQ